MTAADLRTPLALLRFGDSFFPSGSSAFSFGLEGSRTDGRVAGAQAVEQFVLQQLRERWGTMDRAFVLAAHAAAGDHARLAFLDRRIEAATLPTELREGSKRSGRALLSMHRNLGNAAAAAYLDRVAAARAPGHLAVVQGLVGAGLGLDARMVVLLSGYTHVAAVLAAALRLGVAGHIDIHRVMDRVLPELIAVIETDPPAVEYAHCYTPAQDVAAMRHETHSSRLFFN